jgi:hypothetical protein
MNIVIDTNILGRMAEPGRAQAQLALDATDALRKRGDVPCVLPQILYEFWVVATRPAAQNGLGLSAVQAEIELVRIEAMFPLLAETAAVFPEWRRLIRLHQVVGKNAHDCRIVAAMTIHGVTDLLTLLSPALIAQP